MDIFTEIDKTRYDNSIMPKMRKILDEIINRLNILPNQILYLGLFGSQNHRINIEDSDIDCVCAILPSPEKISFNSNYIHIGLKNQYNGICHIRDIREIFNDILHGNINIHDIFLTPYALVNINYKDILENIYLSDIKYITFLNHVNLMKKYEEMLEHYYQRDIAIKIKSFIGAIRVKDILDKMLLDINYATLLTPENWKELLRKRFENNVNQQEFEYFNKLRQKQKIMLQKYYQTHSEQHKEEIRDILDSYQNKIMTRYFELQKDNKIL